MLRVICTTIGFALGLWGTLAFTYGLFNGALSWRAALGYLFAICLGYALWIAGLAGID